MLTLQKLLCILNANCCFVLFLENAEMKFKEFILSLKTMIFSEDEALCVVDLLKEKSGVIQDALKKVSIFFVMSTCGSSD